MTQANQKKTHLLKSVLTPEVANSQKGEQNGQEAQHTDKGGSPSSPTYGYSQVDEYQVDSPGSECSNDFRIPIPPIDPILFGPDDAYQQTHRHEREAREKKLEKEVVQITKGRQLIKKPVRFLTLQLTLLEQVDCTGNEGQKEHPVGQEQEGRVQINP